MFRKRAGKLSADLEALEKQAARLVVRAEPTSKRAKLSIVIMPELSTAELEKRMRPGAWSTLDPEFRERYARARQADFLGAQILEISDDGSGGIKSWSGSSSRV